MNQIQSARESVARAARKAYAAGLFAGTSGNLSVILREEGLIAITPSGVRYEGMTAEDIVLIHPDGTVYEGVHKPSSEYRLHSALYQGRPATGAVVHTHSPYATAFAACNREIPLILIEMAVYLGGDVPVAPLAIPGSEDVGRGALAAMKAGDCCLLANHGVVCAGAALEEAYMRAEYVEDAARICSIALQIGGPVRIPPAMERKIRDSLAGGNQGT